MLGPQTLTADKASPPETTVQQLQHAIIGRAALEWFSEQGSNVNQENVGELIDRYDDRIQDLIDLQAGATIPAPTDQFPDEDYSRHSTKIALIPSSNSPSPCWFWPCGHCTTRPSFQRQRRR